MVIYLKSCLFKKIYILFVLFCFLLLWKLTRNFLPNVYFFFLFQLDGNKNNGRADEGAERLLF